MLTLMLPAIDDQEAVEVRLEHSLVSLSKWESLYKKPFFSKEDKNEDEFKDYVLMMVLDEKPPVDFKGRITRRHLAEVREYINDPHTATTFREDPNQPPSREIITAEVIYYWLVTFNIDWEAQHWHLSNLMTLVRVCGIRQAKPKKMTTKQQLAEYRRLNEQRRRELGTSG